MNCDTFLWHCSGKASKRSRKWEQTTSTNPPTPGPAGKIHRSRHRNIHYCSWVINLQTSSHWGLEKLFLSLEFDRGRNFSQISLSEMRPSGADGENDWLAKPMSRPLLTASITLWQKRSKPPHLPFVFLPKICQECFFPPVSPHLCLPEAELTPETQSSHQGHRVLLWAHSLERSPRNFCQWQIQMSAWWI